MCYDTTSAEAKCIDDGHIAFCDRKEKAKSGCKHGQSDCDSDSECLGDLVCTGGKVCCNADEILKNGQCAPPCSCEGKQCGDDGCGGECGTCDPGYSCNTKGVCIDDSPVCEPACEGKDCGDDGCGGVCRSEPKTGTLSSGRTGHRTT